MADNEEHQDENFKKPNKRKFNKSNGSLLTDELIRMRFEALFGGKYKF